MPGLKGWKKALMSAVDYPWDSDIDANHPDYTRCGSTMDFHGYDDSGDFEFGDGYWKCTSCCIKVTEDNL